jgi:phosphate starvation-inducible PhoH-like protein
LEKIIRLFSNQEAVYLYGNLDSNLRQAEKKYQVTVSAKNDRLKISGDDKQVEKAYEFFMGLLDQQRKTGHTTHSNDAHNANAKAQQVEFEAVQKEQSEPEHIFHKGKLFEPKSKRQGAYLKSIQTRDIVFAIGPAGTGKTYLAVAAAIQALRKKEVKKIILARPAVEAGESLGFLPGDLEEKVNPYLRPLYDALYDMMSVEEVAKCFDREMIEIAPLAYMRGRTLNSAFVILDEAQNCTYSQMKMFLTRLGESSKMVLTGDITQIDLPRGQLSGLVEANKILTKVEGIEFVYMDDKDVVRHPLVRSIIKAYESHEQIQSKS